MNLHTWKRRVLVRDWLLFVAAIAAAVLFVTGYDLAVIAVHHLIAS